MNTDSFLHGLLAGFILILVIIAVCEIAERRGCSHGESAHTDHKFVCKLAKEE